MDLWEALMVARGVTDPYNGHHLTEYEREAISVLIVCGEKISADALEKTVSKKQT